MLRTSRKTLESVGVCDLLNLCHDFSFYDRFFNDPEMPWGLL